MRCHSAAVLATPALPDELRSSLPTIAELERTLPPLPDEPHGDDH